MYIANIFHSISLSFRFCVEGDWTFLFHFWAVELFLYSGGSWLCFSLCQDCGPSVGLAAGIPSLVATALLVALLFILIHRRRSSTEPTEVICGFFGSGCIGRNWYFHELAFGQRLSGFVSVFWGQMVDISAPWFLSQTHDITLQAELICHTTSAHLSKSVAIRMVFGVAKREEECLLPWQTHFKGHKLHKENGDNLRKDKRQTGTEVPGRHMSSGYGFIYLCPFPHLNTYQSQGSLPTPPLPNPRWLWGPYSEFKGHSDWYPTRFHCCDATVLHGLWVLIPSSVYEHSRYSHTGTRSQGDRKPRL